jgi:DNA-binding XRE family transcriptional regulator
MKPITLNEIIEEQKKDPEFVLLYEAEQRLNQISRQVYEMRKKAGLTQEELAKKAHTTQAVIARLESGKDLNRIPSLSLLDRLAVASNAKLQISFEYKVN